MVRLNRIYTKTGDAGKTSLAGGSFVAKHHGRIEVIGAIDEANSMIGVARLSCSAEIDESLKRIQHDLFDAGADIATPADATSKTLRILEIQVLRLEQEIDAWNAYLEPLDSFVLPSGSSASSYLHLARTIVRRAERAAFRLHETEPLNPHLLCYLNRLSDHLFVLARICNNNGTGDIFWVPGVNR